MVGYVRQSVADILPGEEVRAEPLNAEFNRLQTSFGTMGHTHDGTTGNAPKINLNTSVQGVLSVSMGGTGSNNLNGLATSEQGQIAENALPRSGGTMSGPIDLGSQKITNLATPTANSDAATLKYVQDTLASVDTSGFAAHVNNKNNPHETTKAQVGLGNVDNTSDVNKPVSVPTQNALALKAPLESPILTGTPQAPTPIGNISNTQIATTAFVQSVVGSVDLYSASLINRDARTSNIQLIKSDKSKLIDITSGTFTQTFAAASSLGSGWFCFIRNSGTGDITFDPNGSELIDGLASFISYPGEIRLIQCDGTQLRSVVLTSFYKIFTQSDNFIKPPGYNSFGALIRSGGSSGALSNNTGTAPGGGGGGCFPLQIFSQFLPSTNLVMVGSGGAPKSGTSGNGLTGGDSSFAGVVVGSTFFSRGGGVGYVNTTGNGTGFEGINPLNQSTQGTSIYGGLGSNLGSGLLTTIFGGGSGGSKNSAAITPPGTSVFSGNGGEASTSGNGTNGTIPSGGGGAGFQGFASGAGARGQVDIWGIL